MDKIYIRDLSLRAVIGADAEERREKQDLILNIVLECDMEKAIRSDDLADAVDYRALKRKIIRLVEGSSYHLIESLADAVAALCLDDHGAAAVKVIVDKPGALRFARSVAVEVCRP